MFEEIGQEDQLVIEIDSNVNPASKRGVKLICNILENMENVDANFQEVGFMDASMRGQVGEYSFEMRPNIGIIVALNRMQMEEPEYSYRYKTIEGAIGWILCKSGYGNNTSWYEAFSTFIEPQGEFNGFHSSMEVQPSPEEKRKYMKIMKGIENMINKTEGELPQSSQGKSESLPGLPSPSKGDEEDSILDFDIGEPFLDDNDDPDDE